MAKQYDFGRNQILRAEFLNSLQDVLQTYLDNFLLSRSGSQVLLVGTVESPTVVTIDGRMRQIPTTLAGNLSGPAGGRDVYVSVRTDGFTLDAVPTGDVPTGGDLVAFRRVGTCTWNGTTVTGVHTTPVRTNADFLGGRSSSYEPVPYAVAVSGPDGRLHPGWFPGVKEREEAVGTVRRQWAVSNAAFSIPTGWALMDGRVLGPSDHSFPGVATITLPDMRNRAVLGADITKAYGALASALDTAAAAPGMGGVGGSNSPRSFSHTHGVAAHHHVSQGHHHAFNHSHTVPPHSHFLPHFNQGHVDSPGPVREQRMFRGRTNLAPGQTTTQNNINTQTEESQVNTSTQPAGNTSVGLSTPLDVRPAHVGLVYLVKVH